jgi:hypothetical protein
MTQIEEIRKRCEHKLTGKNKHQPGVGTKSSRHGEGVYDAIIRRLYECEYEDIPALLAEIDRLIKEVAEYKQALQNWHEGRSE